MSNKGGYSREGLFGNIIHYDSKGHKIGESRPGFFGGYNNYDAKGHKVGESRPAFLGGYNNYDAKGHKTGSVRPGFLGSQVHYDAKGNRVGTSDPGFWGDQKRTGSFGDNSNIINNAGSAAGVRRDDRTIMTAIEIAALGSSIDASQKASNVRVEVEAAPTHHRNDDFSRSDNQAPQASSTPARTVQYVIARSSSRSENLYCQTSDAFQVGDWAVVENTEERVQVLAVIECLEDALPPEVDKGLRVKAV